jgi:hypothetical protein
VQLRVVTDQPWDVKADVLAIPIVGDPAFDGPLGEIDRRVGGELKALTAFKEVSGKRYWTAVVSAGELTAGRVVTVGAGEADKLDRRPSSGSARRRSAGCAAARRRASPCGSRRSPPSSTVAHRPSRSCSPGRRRGLVRSQAPVPRGRRGRAAAARGADPRRPRGGCRALQKAAERGIVVGEGSNWARAISNRSANDVTPDVLAEESRALAEQHGLWIDVIEPDRARELGMGHVPRGRPGQRQPAPADRHALRRRGREGQAGSPPRDRRQGRLLRLRRHQHQAGRPDGRDEDGQDRCLHRDRGHRHRRPPLPGDAPAGAGPGGREHAGLALDAARRRRQGDERQVRRHHEHRRRGSPDPRATR